VKKPFYTPPALKEKVTTVVFLVAYRISISRGDYPIIEIVLQIALLLIRRFTSSPLLRRFGFKS